MRSGAQAAQYHHLPPLTHQPNQSQDRLPIQGRKSITSLPFTNLTSLKIDSLSKVEKASPASPHLTNLKIDSLCNVGKASPPFPSSITVS